MNWERAFRYQTKKNHLNICIWKRTTNKFNKNIFFVFWSVSKIWITLIFSKHQIKTEFMSCEFMKSSVFYVIVSYCFCSYHNIKSWVICKLNLIGFNILSMVFNITVNCLILVIHIFINVIHSRFLMFLNAFLGRVNK